MSIAIIFDGGPLNGLSYRSDSLNEIEAKLVRTIFHTTGQGSVGKKCDWHSFYALPPGIQSVCMVPIHPYTVLNRDEDEHGLSLTVVYTPLELP
jgi:hypothetical protein